ncbi:MAG TPA: sigma-54 dependent transcriptional regulator [Candidatus Acidoferrales bacterium]|nr:sigma-54 dependent transcriptional regulator [Candidatus Acidoferrales bacterium]
MFPELGKNRNRSSAEESPRSAAQAAAGSAVAPSEPTPQLLVVDDDPTVRSQLERLYAHSGYSVVSVGSAEEAIARLQEEDIDFVITDIKLPGMDGVQLIAHLHDNFPDVPVIAITGYSDIQTAVNVLKLGASDFVVKPFDLAAVQESTRVALEKSKVYTEIRHLRRALKNRAEFGGMLSKTPEMHRVFEIIRMVAPTDMTVLVEGETGTGKELVASAIHYHSPRRERPFVTINCAGFPESLLESELFGYEKGAFTGADQAKAGKIELAHGGTLFLDEIESMSIVMQGKMLRVLEDQKVQRLGGNKPTRVDMRVIAATNVPLKTLVAQGKMRTDFYYRINVIPIHLIPLRERKIDIPLLVQDFLHHHPVAVSKGITAVSKPVMTLLMDYAWPGNIRELQNVLERAIVLTTGKVIEAVDLPDLAEERESKEPTYSSKSLDEWLREQEKQYLAQKLEAFDGNVGLTAKSCGIGVRTLSRKMRLYGLDRRLFKKRKHIPAGPASNPPTVRSRFSPEPRV